MSESSLWGRRFTRLHDHGHGGPPFHQALREGRKVGIGLPTYEDGWQGGMPVPYTHLRVHQTVLDLVFRLLLV